MDEHRAILALVEDYFRGLYTGDVALLRSVFHPQAALFAQPGGEAYYRPLDAYLDGVERRRSPQAGGERFRMKLLGLEVMHDLAIARVHVPALGHDYYNHLSLLRQDGRWRIVNKTFTEPSPGAVPA